jgi:hypothetical protein
MLTSGKHFDVLAQRTPQWLKRPVSRLVKQYRARTSGLRIWPSFIILGARRCGTTSLYRYLTGHPQVLPALKKEVCYFNDHAANGDAWYRGHFPSIGEKWLIEAIRGRPVITGEASPSYLSDPYLPERVYRLLPDVKLLAILRNPVDAAYSSYHFGLKLGAYTKETVRFDRLVRDELAYCAEPEGAALLRRRDRAAVAERHPLLLARHIYVDQLRFWYDVFPQDAIKVVIFEEFMRNKARHLAEIFEFLGLRPYELTPHERYNACDYRPMDPILRDQMLDYFAPHNQRLSDFLGKLVPWEDGYLQGSGELPVRAQR